MPRLNKEERDAYNRAYYELNKDKNKCEHNRQKSRCKECGGSQICEHNRQKSACKECVGGSICEHKKIYRKIEEKDY